MGDVGVRDRTNEAWTRASLSRYIEGWMFRRWGVAALLLSGASVGTWKGAVAAYFGRVDVATWSAEHPAPPPPRIGLGRHSIEVQSTLRIVPSSGLSGQFSVQRANNNLDVTRHDDGRV
jgi:hypothetical protein